ncbi:hypothetical protein B0H16DRAFT_1461102 [Mycena metata]|uniref:Uncharacterized protein n=1 Tax=Mycena metata TaxID=1033252 RepID=A0AAD7N7V7_9AGAR|nr:hypothetical protein B0H16DRAFT_1461102 [Mycena metata]
MYILDERKVFQNPRMGREGIKPRRASEHNALSLVCELVGVLRNLPGELHSQDLLSSLHQLTAESLSPPPMPSTHPLISATAHPALDRIARIDSATAAARTDIEGLVLQLAAVFTPPVLQALRANAKGHHESQDVVLWAQRHGVTRAEAACFRESYIHTEAMDVLDIYIYIPCVRKHRQRVGGVPPLYQIINQFQSNF